MGLIKSKYIILLRAPNLMNKSVKCIQCKKRIDLKKHKNIWGFGTDNGVHECGICGNWVCGKCSVVCDYDHDYVKGEKKGKWVIACEKTCGKWFKDELGLPGMTLNQMIGIPNRNLSFGCNNCIKEHKIEKEEYITPLSTDTYE